MLKQSASAPASGWRDWSRVGGSYLYELPWYMFIGAPGSGKTTALVNSGPARSRWPRRSGGASVRGVGGTRNCDWWFTDEAVLIDTAGRYTTQDSDQRGRRERLGRLPRACCSKSRPRQPINGVLLTVSVPDLLQQTPAERKDARRHAARAPAGAARASSACACRSTCWSPRPTCSPASPRYFGDARQGGARPGLGLHASRYAPTSSDDPLVNFGSEFAALREAPARPRRAAAGRRARRAQARRHLRLPAAVRRRCAALLGGLPRAGVRAGGAFEAAAAAARRLLHQRHAGRHADRPRAGHAGAHLRHRAAPAAAGRRARQELLPAPRC